MKTKSQLVIVDENGMFAAKRGSRIVWVSEYPDATLFTWSESKKALAEITTDCCMIENYGLENQRSIWQ